MKLVGELFHDVGGGLAAQTVLERFTKAGERNGRAGGRYRYVQSADGDRHFQFPIALKQIEGESYRILKSTSTEVSRDPSSVAP